MPSRSSRTFGDVEGVGDHGQPAMGDLAGEGEGGRAAPDGDGALVGHAGGGGPGDRALRVEVRVAPIGRAGPRGQRRAAVGADDAALACQALEVAADRRGGHAQVVGELGHARAAVGAQVVDQASATLRLPHARILRMSARIVNASCAICAHARLVRARKLRTRGPGAYDAADGLPAWRGPRPGRVQLAERHLHRAGPRPSPEPAQGAPAGGRRSWCPRPRWSSSSGPSSGRWATTGTGVLLDPEIGVGPAIADGSLPGRAGLIVAVEATGYEGEPGARVSRVLPGWSVEQVKRLGASAAKLLVYYHPDAPNAGAQERLVADVAAACREARPRAVPGAAVVRPRWRQGHRRRAASGGRRDRPPADRDRRGRAQGRVPVRRGRHRRGALARGLRRAGRGHPGAVGAAVGRRRRRDVRAPGRGSPARRARAACWWAGRCGRRRRR